LLTAFSFDSKEDKIPFHLEDCHVLGDNIEVICDLPGSAIPFWKILPSQFMLYPHIDVIKLATLTQIYLN
jgi:hypothetical protein